MLFFSVLNAKLKAGSWRAYCRAIGGALLSVVLLASALAAVSPAFHDFLHPDNQSSLPDAQHQCAATLLASGTVEAACVASFAFTGLWTEFTVQMPRREPAPAGADYPWSPERAPPGLSFFI